MKNSDNILNEIKELAPKLSTIKKENAFYASDDYFEALSAKIQHKISDEQKTKKTIHLFNYFKQPQFAIAASIIIILVVSSVFYTQHTSNQKLSMNNSIYWDEILNENTTIIDKMDEALLVEVLTNETTKNINSQTNTINQPNQSTLDEVSDDIESAYNNDVFNEL